MRTSLNAECWQNRHPHPAKGLALLGGMRAFDALPYCVGPHCLQFDARIVVRQARIDRPVDKRRASQPLPEAAFKLASFFRQPRLAQSFEKGRNIRRNRLQRFDSELRIEAAGLRQGGPRRLFTASWRSKPSTSSNLTITALRQRLAGRRFDGLFVVVGRESQSLPSYLKETFTFVR